MFSNPVTSSTTSLDFAELEPSVVVRAGWGQAPNAGSSTDGGSTWTPVGSRPNGSAAAGVVAVSADGDAWLWSPANAAVHVSLDGGATWTASAGLPDQARVASDRVDPARFYAFAAGRFYVSTDRGATFTATAAAGLPADGGVRFRAVPGKAGHVWLAGGSTSGAYGLWFSDDAGASFRKLRNVDEADTSGFGKAAPGHRYPALYTSARIRGERGIFRSVDAGRRWERINDDDHQWAWTGQTITGDPRVYGRVYVATNGRGVVYGEPRRGHHHSSDCDDEDRH
jgi:hypothetical protein